MFSAKHRLAKWRRIISPQLCFNYVMLVDDSPIVIERVNCADWVMKIHFPFLRSLHLLTSTKYRRSITQQLNRSRLQDDFFECRFVTSRLKLTQIQHWVICRMGEKNIDWFASSNCFSWQGLEPRESCILGIITQQGHNLKVCKYLRFRDNSSK